MIRYSKQNDLLYNVIAENGGHYTADDLYQMLKLNYERISLATIYRNLKKLNEEGLITRISIPNGADRYSACLDDHYHFLCTNCGKLYDVRIAKFEDINNVIEEKTEHKVRNHNILFNGLCKNCRVDNKKVID